MLRLMISSVKICTATFFLETIFFRILVHENASATNVIRCDVDEKERSTIKEEATSFLILQEGIKHCRKSVCLHSDHHQVDESTDNPQTRL